MKFVCVTDIGRPDDHENCGRIGKLHRGAFVLSNILNMGCDNANDDNQSIAVADDDGDDDADHDDADDDGKTRVTKVIK